MPDQCRCREIVQLDGDEARVYAHDHLRGDHVDIDHWEFRYTCPATGVAFLLDHPHRDGRGDGPPRLRTVQA